MQNSHLAKECLSGHGPKPEQPKADLNIKIYIYTDLKALNEEPYVSIQVCTH